MPETTIDGTISSAPANCRPLWSGATLAADTLGTCPTFKITGSLMPTNLKSADTVIVNAKVHTLDARQPSVSTIVIANGRILAAGGNHLLGEHRGPRTRVHDAKIQTITPGLIDGHIHPIQGSEITVGVDFGRVSTFDGFLAVLRTEAARVLGENPAGWVRGWNLDYGVSGSWPYLRQKRRQMIAPATPSPEPGPSLAVSSVPPKRSAGGLLPAVPHAR